jgi:MFS family permease
MIIDLQVSDWWMPFLTGSIFIIPFLFAVWILDHSPNPTEKDIEQRTARKPISRKEQLEIIKKFKNVLIPIVISYAVFTIVRDFIEDFANEFWIENGYANKVGIFAQTSTLVSIIVLIIIALFFLFKSNYTAFKWIHILVLVGLSLLLGATFLYNIQAINPFTWMVIATTGLYFSYLPFNCLYFERFIAVYKINGNVGFVMYIADAFGYLGTVLVLLIKELLPIHYQWNTFFTTIFYSAGIVGIILITFTFIIHRKKLKNQYV